MQYMKSKQIGSSKYFTFMEFQESAQSSYGDLMSSKTEKRPPFKFNTGAVYEGEWRGNHREGYGIQTW